MYRRSPAWIHHPLVHALWIAPVLLYERATYSLSRV